MIDPFKISGPTCISFSGGRTSAYMLHKVIEANGGLPDEAKVIFNNTGKEREETLMFVERCSNEWRVPIVWLEYRLGSNFSVVDFATASRAGEPFDQIIEHRGFVLPNIRSPYCSSELKTRTAHRYLRSIGWVNWETFLGIRADEPVRVANFRRNPFPESPAEEICMPLLQKQVTKWTVKAFWDKQLFDLELANIDGITPEGNCDLCFKKSQGKVMSLIRQNPARAVWWAKKEAEANGHAKGNGNRFVLDRANYSQMHRFALDQVDMDFDQSEQSSACFCGD